MKLRTFRITLSPKESIDHNCEVAIINYIQKKASFYHVVAEYGTSGKRHLHAAVCWKVPSEANDITGYMWDIVKKYHPTSLRKVAVNKHAMVDHAWYDSYLVKEKDVVVLATKYDRDRVAECFPSESEQEALMNHVVEGTTEKVADPRMARLCKEWTDYAPNASTYEDAGRFLNYIMYAAKTEPVILDHRRVCQLGWSLYKYRNSIIDVEAEYVRYGNQLTGNCP